MQVDPNCIRRIANWTSVKAYHKFDKPTFDEEKVAEDLPVYSPKLFELVKKIRELDEKDQREHGKTFKHFIFSDVKTQGAGAKVTTSALVASGFNLAYEGSMNLKSDKELLKTKSQNIVLLSSTAVFNKTINARFKKEILTKFNQRPDNIHGELIRIIIADGGFKEGVDMFDVKYTHILEPQISKADLRQAIGRTTRLCGQKGLEFHPTKGWRLHVFLYDVDLPRDMVEQYGESTMFDMYLKYKNIDLRKLKLVDALEVATIHGSVDYELNKNVHRFEIKDDDGYDLEWLFPSKGGAAKSPTFECKGKCGTRPTKKVPLGTPVLALVYFSLNEKMPKLKDKFKKPRLFFCDLLKNDPEFCERAREAWDDLNGFVRKYSVQIQKSVENREYMKMPSYNRETYLRIIKYIRPSILNRARRSQETENPSKPDTPKTPKEPESEEQPEPPTPPPPQTSLGFLEVRNHVRENFSQYTWPKVQLENMCAPRGGDTSIVRFTPTQDFIRNYFTPESPQKGMLLCHSVGSGKTCCAIATATSTFEKNGYTILWVTRSSLKSDIWKNMFDQVCNLVIQERLKNGFKMPEKMAEKMRLLSKSWSIRPMSYKQFSNLISGKNKFYDDLVKKNGKEDPLKKTLLIIDEAHKLYGGADLSSTEKPDMTKLHKALMDSYKISGEDSVKLLMMTGTPITNDPMEIIKLINLCKERHSQMSDDFDAFSSTYLDSEGRFTKKGKWRYLNEIAGYVSYLSRERDARQFAQPIIQNVRVDMSTNENDSLQEIEEKYSKELDELMLEKEGHSRQVKELKATLKQKTKKKESPITLKSIEKEIKHHEAQLEETNEKIRETKTEMRQEKAEAKLDPSQQGTFYKKCVGKKGKTSKKLSDSNSESNSNSDE